MRHALGAHRHRDVGSDGNRHPARSPELLSGEVP
jgi:hypothetical protein